MYSVRSQLFKHNGLINKWIPVTTRVGLASGKVHQQAGPKYYKQRTWLGRTPSVPIVSPSDKAFSHWPSCSSREAVWTTFSVGYTLTEGPAWPAKRERESPVPRGRVEAGLASSPHRKASCRSDVSWSPGLAAPFPLRHRPISCMCV